jgi:hypothetical protein
MAKSFSFKSNHRHMMNSLNRRILRKEAKINNYNSLKNNKKRSLKINKLIFICIDIKDLSIPIRIFMTICNRVKIDKTNKKMMNKTKVNRMINFMRSKKISTNQESFYKLMSSIFRVEKIQCIIKNMGKEYKPIFRSESFRTNNLCCLIKRKTVKIQLLCEPILINKTNKSSSNN